MPIIDLWGNPTTITILTAAGYTPPTTFSTQHRLFPMVLSTIRETDIEDVGLVYRWLMAMDAQWIDIDARIRSVPNLRSPDECPNDYLTYLRKDIGILDDLAYLWDVLSVVEQRKLIKNFVLLCQFRGSPYGLLTIMEAVTGNPTMIFDYFDYRWICSGDGVDEDETALGYEIEPGDPWLLTEEHMPSGFRAEDVQYATFVSGAATHGNYKFKITAEMTSLDNPPIPEMVYVKYPPNGSTVLAKVWTDGVDYYAVAPMDYTFGLELTNLSTEIGDFLLFCEIDQYVSDIYIEDTLETVNRDAVVALAKFCRPQSERFYIRYFSMIENFDNLERWDGIAASGVIANEIVTVTATGVFPNDGFFFVDMPTFGHPEDAWGAVELKIKMRIPDASYEQWIGPFLSLDVLGHTVCFQVSVRSKTSSLVKTPNADWQIVDQIVGGGSVFIDGGTIDTYDTDVFYTIRMYSYNSGGVRYLSVYRDEEVIADRVMVGAANKIGTVGIFAQAGNTVDIQGPMTVHPIPLVYDYVGV